ncbi:hypothetical protein BpHYR1_036628, partial [Brachionus plicatilis]
MFILKILSNKKACKLSHKFDLFYKSTKKRTKCKTTNLMHALKIEPTIEYVEIIKNQFIINLLRNTYTRKIVEQTIHLRLKEMINELTEYGEEDLDDLPLKLEDQCKVNKY